MKHQQRIFLCYSQVIVFDLEIENTSCNWTDDHVSQGFGWRECSVSFMTLEEAGRAEIMLKVEPYFQPRKDAIRTIKVPFAVPEHGRIGVGSITEEFEVQLPEGHYSLYYEAGYGKEEMWIDFTFVPDDSNEAEVLVCDSGLHPNYPLTMTAEPAI